MADPENMTEELADVRDVVTAQATHLGSTDEALVGLAADKFVRLAFEQQP